MTTKIELEVELFFNLGPPERQCAFPSSKTYSHIIQVVIIAAVITITRRV